MFTPLPNRRSVIVGLAASIAAGLCASGVLAQLALTRRNLTGVWRGVERTGGIAIAGEVIFQPNGTYRRTNRYQQLMNWTSGTYTISENWIHFEVEAYGPVYYMGVFQYPPPSETWMVDHFDAQNITARIGQATRIDFERVA